MNLKGTHSMNSIDMIQATAVRAAIPNENIGKGGIDSAAMRRSRRPPVRERKNNFIPLHPTTAIQHDMP